MENHQSFENVKEKGVEYKKYSTYLEEQADKLDLQVRDGNIVDNEGNIRYGQYAEGICLGVCKIGDDEKIPLPLSGCKSDTKVKAIIFDFVRKHQPDQIKDVNISRQVEGIIRSFLGRESIVVDVRFYTAVGTPLDYQYGVDGWIEIADTDGEIEIITFDFKTKNTADAEVYADVAFNMQVEEINDITKKIVDNLFNFSHKVIAIYKERIKD